MHVLHYFVKLIVEGCQKTSKISALPTRLRLQQTASWPMMIPAKRNVLYSITEPAYTRLGSRETAQIYLWYNKTALADQHVENPDRHKTFWEYHLSSRRWTAVCEYTHDPFQIDKVSGKKLRERPWCRITALSCKPSYDIQLQRMIRASSRLQMDTINVFCKPR